MQRLLTRCSPIRSVRMAYLARSLGEAVVCVAPWRTIPCKPHAHLASPTLGRILHVRCPLCACAACSESAPHAPPGPRKTNIDTHDYPLARTPRGHPHTAPHLLVGSSHPHGGIHVDPIDRARVRTRLRVTAHHRRGPSPSRCTTSPLNDWSHSNAPQPRTAPVLAPASSCVGCSRVEAEGRVCVNCRGERGGCVCVRVSSESSQRVLLAYRSAAS
jgi:hypothetical protein